MHNPFLLFIICCLKQKTSGLKLSAKLYGLGRDLGKKLFLKLSIKAVVDYACDIQWYTKTIRYTSHMTGQVTRVVFINQDVWI